MTKASVIRSNEHHLTTSRRTDRPFRRKQHASLDAMLFDSIDNNGENHGTLHNRRISKRLSIKVFEEIDYTYVTMSSSRTHHNGKCVTRHIIY
jgi:hypothetical protein